jgi:hypothetical protein
MPYKDPVRQKAAQQASYQRNAKRLGDKQKRWRERFHQMVLEYKLAHPCVDCGEADPIVLEFDHRPGTLKCFAVSMGRYMARALVLKEMEKCDVRCANCHRRMTVKRRKEKQNIVP